MPECFQKYTEERVHDYMKLGVLALTIVPKGHISKLEEAVINTINKHTRHVLGKFQMKLIFPRLPIGIIIIVMYEPKKTRTQLPRVIVRGSFL